jgi:contractile injection system tape measure protein
MSERPNHVIRRQIVEIDLHGTESDGMALQRRLPDLCNRLVTPVLDLALARCDPNDQWIVVERLDVDLGRMSPDALERDLPEAIGRAVESFFRDHPSPSGQMEEAGNIQHRTDRETADDALIMFLRTGRLPWSFRIPPGRHLEEVLLTAWTAREETPSPARRGALLDVLAVANARRRLQRQFSPEFLKSLLRLLSDAAAATVDVCLRWVQDLDHNNLPAGEQLLAQLWESAFAGISSGSMPSPRELLVAAWRAVPADTRGHGEVRALLAPVLPDLVTDVEHGATQSRTASHPPDRTRLLPMRPIAAGGEGVDGIYVDNAGVVLLHPFLPRCFEALGIAEGGRLVQPERALSLLHYLATGELSAPEYVLVLAKVLCDIAIDEPVGAVTLSDAESAEAIALLEATIRHWEALRDTGTDALRSTFLMRSGMLTADDDGGWLLRVESQTFDILLDHLPWGISMIQLPWMQRLLRVEWR